MNPNLWPCATIANRRIYPLSTQRDREIRNALLMEVSKQHLKRVQ